nr:helix-turn-helix domain-containing protein [uncultured Agathobaculum sp.]
MNKLRIVRDSDPRKLTQKDIAAFLGVDRSTYNKYETGDSEPNFDTICRLADFFGVSVEYLMGRPGATKRPLTSEDMSGLTEKQIKILELMGELPEQDQDDLLQQAEYRIWLKRQKESGQ